MNILYFFAEQDRYMDKWQHVHILDDLQQAGHSVTIFNPLNYESIEQANELLIEELKKLKASFNLFMTCVGTEYINKETISRIKEMGLPTLLICFDNFHAPFMHKKIAPSFDLVWLTSFETEPMFKKWGCKTLFMPYAANPNTFSPSRLPQTNNISFIGSPYGSRVDKINHLLHAEINCSVYTDVFNKVETKEVSNSEFEIKEKLIATERSLRFPIGRKMLYAAFIRRYMFNQQKLMLNSKWLTIEPSVPFDKIPQIYSSSSLSLNIIELRNTYVLKKPLYKLHLRTFEIPMSGGLQIVSYNNELSQYFENNKEIVFYSSPEEFVSKAKFYTNSKNSAVTAKMKENARKRCVSDHTWTKRFNLIFEHFGL